MMNSRNVSVLAETKERYWSSVTHFTEERTGFNSSGGRSHRMISFKDSLGNPVCISLGDNATVIVTENK
jgi:hypothetical protein